MRASVLAGTLLLPAPVLAQQVTAAVHSPWALLAQALLSLAVVVGIIYLVYFGLRRLDNRRPGADSAGPMRVIQARCLGGDRWLYLVEIEERRIVVGAASGQIARIAELEGSGGESEIER